MHLTKDGDKLICLLYKAYKERLKEGVPKARAKHFGNQSSIQESLIPNWSLEDTKETCLELHRSGLVNCAIAIGGILALSLTDYGIIYMENRFKNGLKELLDYINKIKPF